MELGLPQVLVLLAGVIAVIGIRRLSTPSANPTMTTRQALFVWLLLFTGGFSLWLVEALGHS